MRKLLKNKKGIVNVGGIIGGIGGVFTSLFDLMPRPLKFLLFLLVLLVLGGLIQPSMQVFGVYCDSSDNPVSLGVTSIGTNIGLLDEVPDPETINLEVIEPQSVQETVDECSLCYDAGEVTVIDENGIRTNITETRCFYNYGDGCVNCNEVVDLDPTQFTLTGTLRNYCDGDAFRKPTEDLSTLGRVFCGASYLGRCSPPEHYFYESALDKYVCEDETCEGLTASIIWNEKLSKAGGTLIYPEGKDTRRNYESFVGVICEDLEPKLAVFGIPVFDYKLWVLLMLVIMIFWFYMKFVNS